jgi:NAD(P)-dependent dehydrogenase (short-subunit alcohol dehydrogenase family)
MKTNGASVMNVASVQAIGALPNSVAYVTCKHAIVGLTRALAIDHAQDNIRVNCVCPGAVDTPMFRASMQNTEGLAGLLQEIADLHALGRVAQPREVAKVIAFLCGDHVSFITGGIYLVDGGMAALVAGKPPLKTLESGSPG